MSNTTIQCVNVSLLIIDPVHCIVKETFVLFLFCHVQGPSPSEEFSISVKAEFLIKE